jgi:hypothetical protein
MRVVPARSSLTNFIRQIVLQFSVLYNFTDRQKGQSTFAINIVKGNLHHRLYFRRFAI